LANKATIVAEIGQNWCGEMALAETLIICAAQNGADLAKFQLYDSEKLYGEKQKSELSFSRAKYLFDFGKVGGIDVFFSVFDVERVKWCEEIGVKRYKISSRTNDSALFKEIESTGKPVIISYDPAYDKWGYPDTWQNLYCISKYPASLRDLKFKEGMFEDTAIQFGVSEYPKEYQGYSDHTIGLTACKVALARGAQIIEKHFAIDHKTGVDAAWSITPEELRELSNFRNEVAQCL
jgi:sialic acid synthase SpsE